MLLYLFNLSRFMFRAGGACNGAKFEATGFGKASHSICLDRMFFLPSYVFTILPCLSRAWPSGVAATDTTEFSQKQYANGLAFPNSAFVILIVSQQKQGEGC
jgi:hypothetical protein